MFSDIWWLVLLRALTVGLLGILLITRPAATVTVMVFFLGGLLYIIFGILLLSRPLASALIFAWTFGIFAIAGALILAILALKMRKVGQEGLP